MIPVYSYYKNTKILAVQLERKYKDPFDATEECMLRLFCQFIGIKIDYEFCRSKFNITLSQEHSIVQIITTLLMSKTQGELLRSMRKLLPSYHGFEGLGVSLSCRAVPLFLSLSL